ncbi:MAG: hypothetical protein HRT74_03270 [Flavobacteriales bacterium]|nr:hypothetical protein [Flavobacteriales bacterium]
MSEQGIDHLEEDQKERLMLGLMMVAEFLDAKAEGTRAEEIMEAGKAFFAEDDSYMRTYKEIVG